MSHPNPHADYNDSKPNSPVGKALRKKMSPLVHKSKAFKEVRKAFQGINATKEGSLKKSLRRHSDKDKSSY